jgi:anti-sigma B factor antagonist
LFIGGTGGSNRRQPFSRQEKAMILTVNKKQLKADVGLAELHGRLLMGNDSRQVEWTIGEFLKEGVKKVVLDLSGVDTMDSTGVGILVMCHAKLQKEKGDLRIVSKAGLVHDTLLMTHVDRIVRFFPTVDDAAKDF